MADKRMPALCRWGFHKWSTWGEKFSIPDSRFAFEFQQKTCLRCGVVHERKI